MKKIENYIEKEKYYLVDASKDTLGRISTKIAVLLTGKNSVNYRPNIIANNVVVVINADNVHLSGTKELSKQYFRHSGFHGGIKITNFSRLKKEKPEELIRKAVKGMLPKNRLQLKIIKNLKIFAANQHPYKISKDKNDD